MVLSLLKEISSLCAQAKPQQGTVPELQESHLHQKPDIMARPPFHQVSTELDSFSETPFQKVWA